MSISAHAHPNPVLKNGDFFFESERKLKNEDRLQLQKAINVWID
jgi:hypothetical protein